MSALSRVGLVAAAGLMMAAGAAVAQAPPAEGGPAAPGPGEREERGERGPMPPSMRGMMMRMHHGEESRAARFRFRKGDALVDIRCAADEPTKACVDAGSALLDKLNPPAAR